jgi:metal-responsive CopG/Arc/MetJ family transcriptional regulator
MPAKARKSKVYSISLPPELADLAEFLAKRESRTISELFREALREYQKQRVGKMFDEIGEYVRTLPPTSYTEEDVPRLVREVRAEMRAEREAKARKAG